MNKEQVWIMTYDNELFFTTDGGVIWDSSDTEFEKFNPTILFIFPQYNKGFLGGYGSSGLFQTDDGGKNWVKKRYQWIHHYTAFIFLIMREDG